MSTIGYLPSRYTYKPITTLDQEEVELGIFTQQPPESELYEDREPQGTDFTKLLETVIDSNTDMESLIKDKFLFSKEKIQGFLDSNAIQVTLREKVEDLSEQILDLERKTREY